MKKLVLLFLFLCVAGPAWAVSYIQSGYLPDSGKQWMSGGWDLAIANNLAYAGWGAGMTEDEIADTLYYGLEGQYFESAIAWWFSGTALWNDPGIEGDGEYYSGLNSADYIVRSTFKTSNDILADIDVWLRDGVGATIHIDNGTLDALTVYGIEYNDNGYTGLWVVNHNDHATDDLWYMAMHQEYLDAYRNTVWIVDGGWYDGFVLNTANGIMQNTAAPVPEPGTAILLSLGLLYYRNRRSC